MDDASQEQIRDGQLLSAAIKGVRKLRGLTTREVAARMNMSLRSYQRFEAGTTRFNLDHIHRFANATQSDPYAIINAVAIAAPGFAIDSADNKLGTILTVGVEKFYESHGVRIADLDTRTLVGAVTALFDRLAQAIVHPDPTKTWLDTGRAALTAKRPKPGR